MQLGQVKYSLRFNQSLGPLARDGLAYVRLNKKRSREPITSIQAGVCALQFTRSDLRLRPECSRHRCHLQGT